MGYNLRGRKELDTTEQLSTHAYYTRAAVSPVGCRLWGRTESDTTEATQQQQQLCVHEFLSRPHSAVSTLQSEALEVSLHAEALQIRVILSR